MAETIQTYCPCCGGELQGEPEWVGGKALCPYCQKAFIISSAQESTSVDEGVSTSREELSLESDNCDFGGDPNTDDTGSSGNMSTGDAWRKRRFPLWQIDAARFVALIFLVALIVCECIAQDKAEAVKWYRKAAEQGDARAQCNLGVCYDNGEGIAQDKTEAVKWLQRASEQGLEEATKALEGLKP